MKSKIIFLFSLILILSCGKQANPPPKSPLIGRTIDPILEGNFTNDEKNLGNNFCNSLAYKRSNFGAFYGLPNKRFRFDVSRKVCDSEDNTNFTQDLIYTNSGTLSYASASAPALVPTLETEGSGVFALYCANRLQNARVFSSGSILFSYHFFAGTECSGEASQVCVVYEKTNAGSKTVHYKKFLMSTGVFLNLDLRGQEVFTEEQLACDDGNYQSQKFILRVVQDI